MRKGIKYLVFSLIFILVGVALIGAYYNTDNQPVSDKPVDEDGVKYYDVYYVLSKHAYINSDAVKYVSSGNDVVELTVSADDGYKLPNDISVEGCQYLWSPSTGTLLLSKATGKVFVKINVEKIFADTEPLPDETEAPGETQQPGSSGTQIPADPVEPTVNYFKLTNVLNNCYSASGNPTQVPADGSIITLKYSAADKYILPADISVTGCDYLWNDATGTLYISLIKSDVVITINAELEEIFYSVSTVLNNCIADAANVKQISNLDGVTYLRFYPKNGYILPTSISLSGCSGRWDASSGLLVINNVFGDVVVKIDVVDPVYSVSGKWQFNRDLVNSQGKSTISQDVYFRDLQDYSYSRIYINNPLSSYYSVKYVTLSDENGNTSTYEAYNNDLLWNLKHQVIDFGESPQIVSKEFFTWLTENASIVVYDESQQLLPPTISISHNVLTINDAKENLGRTEYFEILINGVISYRAGTETNVVDLSSLGLGPGTYNISVASYYTGNALSLRSNVISYTVTNELAGPTMFYFTNENEFLVNSEYLKTYNSEFEWIDGTASYSGVAKNNWLQLNNSKGFADGSTFKYVKIRYKITPGVLEDGHVPYASLFWRTVTVTGDNVVDPIYDGVHTLVPYGNRYKVELIADGEWHELVYDLSSDARFDGNDITLVRLQFSAVIDGNIMIEQFGLTDQR